MFTSAVLFIFFYLLVKYVNLLFFWKNKNVKYITPVPFAGSFFPSIAQTKSISETVNDLYNTYPEERYCGVFQFEKPVLLLRDPELIKKLTIKEFDSFVDHSTIFKPEVDPLFGKTLFISTGDRWRELRKFLSPAFTSSKMKLIFGGMDECGKRLINYFNKEKIYEYEAKDMFTRYTSDIIATTVFGIENNSIENGKNDFLLMGKDLTDVSGLMKLKMYLTGIPSFILKFFNIKMVSDNLGNFFRTIIDETVNTREKRNIIRQDLVQLLIDAKRDQLLNENENTNDEGPSKIEKPNKLKQAITNEDITAFVIDFYFGASEESSVLMVFVAYELCLNPHIQTRLREEMIETVEKNDGKFTYDVLMSMKYLDMVVQETLRKWPNTIFFDRYSSKDFTIQPERQGEKPVFLPAGTSLWIPIFPIQRDPKYFENPEVFDPERFNEENKPKTKSTFLAFGSGPRICIGSRYALLETKILFYYLLTNFEIFPTEKSIIPIVLSTNHLNLTPKGGFWFGLKHL